MKSQTQAFLTAALVVCRDPTAGKNGPLITEGSQAASSRPRTWELTESDGRTWDDVPVHAPHPPCPSHMLMGVQKLLASGLFYCATGHPF